jgi:1,4-alpha-glucan branching enzyme
MTKYVQDINSIINACHHDASAFLGLVRDVNSDYLVINSFQPEADQVELVVSDKRGQTKVLANLTKVDQRGFFSKKLRRKKHFDYQLNVTHGVHSKIIDDAFAFSPSISDFDLHLLAEGNHHQPHKVLGAHLNQQTLAKRMVSGVNFNLWAPNASRVAVIGDFNHWDGRVHPMTNIKNSGYWSIFIPNIKAGNLYKFELKDNAGKLLPLKADPYAIQAQYRPNTASVVSGEKNYPWHDNRWLEKRAHRNCRNAPMAIYEVHLGSWRRTVDNEFLNYREIADLLIPYTVEMGFTHLQLMPVSEYPFDGSWGYQPVGLFAPTSRFGNKEDFQYFVDQCHQANLGLLIDWVPGHFPSDTHGLAQFDGSHLFEHADPRQGFHPDWNTLIYNYGRVEVANFLRASALHWLDSYHVDGIRVDAVASMLYLDYSRKAGEWVPNEHGGRENLEAVAFLQRFNEELYRQYPGTFSVAEESTSWPGVSRPTSAGGLGFGYKWNMGWMNDTLSYIQRDPIHRQHHHNELTFGLVYAFDENFILPISHDEVVHGKGSMIEKMPGDAWQQFANLRAYYSFMWAHPGKKLLFMGCEFAQGKEWDHDSQLDWQQLDVHWHAGVQRLIKDLNTVYKNTPALYQQDCEQDGFQWLDYQNSQQSIISFIRYSNAKQQAVVIVCNFTPSAQHRFKVGVPRSGHYHELINSDLEIYYGSGLSNALGVASQAQAWQGQAHSIEISVPPLSTLMFVIDDQQGVLHE